MMRRWTSVIRSALMFPAMTTSSEDDCARVTGNILATPLPPCPKSRWPEHAPGDDAVRCGPQTPWRGGRSVREPEVRHRIAAQHLGALGVGDVPEVLLDDAVRVGILRLLVGE